MKAKKSASADASGSGQRASDSDLKLLPRPDEARFVVEPEFEARYPPSYWYPTGASNRHPVLGFAQNAADYKSFLWTPSTDRVEYSTTWPRGGLTSITRLEALIYREKGEIWFTLAYSLHQAGPVRAMTDARFFSHIAWNAVDAGGVTVLWNVSTPLVIPDKADASGGVLIPTKLISKTMTPESVFTQVTTLVLGFPDVFRAHPW